MSPRRFKSILLLLLRLLPVPVPVPGGGPHGAGPNVVHQPQDYPSPDTQSPGHLHYAYEEAVPALILPQLMPLTCSGKGELGHACESARFVRYVRRFQRCVVMPFLIPGLVASCLRELGEKYCKLSQDLKQMMQVVAEKNHEISIAQFEQSRMVAKLLAMVLAGLRHCIHLHKMQQTIIAPMPLVHYASVATDDANQMYLKLWRLYKVLVQNVFAKNCDIDMAAFQQNALCSALLASHSTSIVPRHPVQCSAVRYSGSVHETPLVHPHPLAGSAPVRLCWDDFDSE